MSVTSMCCYHQNHLGVNNLSLFDDDKILIIWILHVWRIVLSEVRMLSKENQLKSRRGIIDIKHFAFSPCFHAILFNLIYEVLSLNHSIIRLRNKQFMINFFRSFSLFFIYNLSFICHIIFQSLPFSYIIFHSYVIFFPFLSLIKKHLM